MAGISGNPVQNLLISFDQALKNKEANKLSSQDVNKIKEAAKDLFGSNIHIPHEQLLSLRNKLVELTGINKATALKKLQGTSRVAALDAALKALDL